jgi:hypothetical protein
LSLQGITVLLHPKKALRTFRLQKLRGFAPSRDIAFSLFSSRETNGTVKEAQEQHNGHSHFAGNP